MLLGPVAQRYFLKKVFLKIPQNSQENTPVGAFCLTALSKQQQQEQQKFGANEFWKIYKNSFFIELALFF